MDVDRELDRDGRAVCQRRPRPPYSRAGGWMPRTKSCSSFPSGPQSDDPTVWRLLFMLFGERPWFVRLWLTLILATLTTLPTLAIVAGPLIAAFAGAGAATVIGAAIRARQSRPTTPDPALEPPP
jgi:hypothetical protein